MDCRTCPQRVCRLILLLLPCGVWAQQAGTQKTEVHPPLQLQHCGAAGCVPEAASITLDAERRWLHDATPGAQQNCFDGKWNKTLCRDPLTCAHHCAVDGADTKIYKESYGLSTSGASLRMNFETRTKYGKNVGSRVYIMDTDETYKMFILKNREIAFDVDVSTLPCGVNAAIYLVAMDARGGQGIGGNTAGAKFGTGYCDAQCPKQLKFISGEANMDQEHGACCAEFDLFEGNKAAASFTAHPCSVAGPTRCEGVSCGDPSKGQAGQGVCDSEGCDFNSYRDGDKSFYGPGLTVDTTRPVTVVTQFVTSDGTDAGELSEVRRLYVQDGKVMKNSKATFAGLEGDASLSDPYCTAEKSVFKKDRAAKNPGTWKQFAKLGGMQAMGAALARGMVLVLSLWDDNTSGMRWLDSSSPGILPADTPGYARGPCPRSSGLDVETTSANAFVAYSNIRYGAIGSTTPGAAGAGAAAGSAPAVGVAAGTVGAAVPAVAAAATGAAMGAAAGAGGVAGSAAAPVETPWGGAAATPAAAGAPALMPTTAAPTAAPAALPLPPAPAAGSWQRIMTPQGEPYYYNAITGKTSWVLPVAKYANVNSAYVRGPTQPFSTWALVAATLAATTLAVSMTAAARRRVLAGQYRPLHALEERLGAPGAASPATVATALQQPVAAAAEDLAQA